MAELRKVKAFDLVDSAADADATLSGSGEIWLKGFLSLNPRAGTLPENGQPVYDGYVSVELKDRNGETLWSYLATARAASKQPARELSKEVVRHLENLSRQHSESSRKNGNRR